MFMLVCNFVNMYIHVFTMYRDVCTDLPILVQVVRIPDVGRPTGTGRCVGRQGGRLGVPEAVKPEMNLNLKLNDILYNFFPSYLIRYPRKQLVFRTLFMNI